MASLERFARNIRIRATNVNENVSRLVRRVALAVDTAVVLATPVDTGRARANWQVGIGSAQAGTLSAPGDAGQAVSQALAQAQGIISSYAGQGTIHITNNLHYIKDLNEGSSRQAPAGFVEAAIVAGVNAIEESKGSIV